jgi:thioredoxin 1
MANANVLEFTAANWDSEVVRSDKPVVVDFWAPWCGPCRVLGPTIDRLAEQYAGRVKVGKLNIDDNQQTAIEYDITAIPQVLIFKGGDKPKSKVVGLTSEKELVKLIDQALAAT